MTQGFNPLQALRLNGIVLRIEQTIGDDIGHLTEGIGIESACRQSGSPEAQSILARIQTSGRSPSSLERVRLVS